ncbi:MAG: hypothetical protein AAFZ05_00960 [Pseudomonadota bacterium]
MIEELLPLLFLFGGGGLVVGYVVVRLITYFADWRPLSWILLVAGLAGAGIMAAFSFATITDPSPATILLPGTLALTGAGIGAAVAGVRTLSAGGRKLRNAPKAAG